MTKQTEGQTPELARRDEQNNLVSTLRYSASLGDEVHPSVDLVLTAAEELEGAFRRERKLAAALEALINVQHRVSEVKGAEQYIKACKKARAALAKAKPQPDGGRS